MTNAPEDQPASASKKYQCDQCGKGYSSVTGRYRHKKVHSKEPLPNKCDSCSKTFLTSALLDCHKTVHEAAVNKAKTLPHRQKCSICNREVRYLERHVQTHESNKTKCDICGKVFPFTRNLKLHMLYHTGERPYKCEVCGKGYVTSTLLKNHFRVHVNEQIKCHICNETFTLLSSLKRHMKCHQEGKFTCAKCGASYKLQQTLRKHAVSCCATSRANVNDPLEDSALFIEDKRVYKCNICGNELSSIGTLRRHQMLHEGSHDCDRCYRSFATAKLLEYHRRSHVKKSYSCEYCDKKFAKLISKKRHFCNGKNKHKCNVCDQIFMSKVQLTWHAKKNNCKPSGQLGVTDITDKQPAAELDKLCNKDVARIPDEGRNECNKCGKIFPRGRNLELHMRSHTGERPFKCDICGKAFVTNTTLKNHSRSHTNEKLKCKECDKTFLFPSDLKRHLISHGWREADGNVTIASTTGQQVTVSETPCSDELALTYANKKYQCSVCDKRYSSRCNYNNHYRRVHIRCDADSILKALRNKCDPTEYHYKCDECNIFFAILVQLKYHSRVHTKKLFKCGNCDMRFLKLSKKKRHLLIHQKKRHSCNACGRTFTNIAQLTWHCRKNNCDETNDQLHIEIKCEEPTIEFPNETGQPAPSEKKFKCDQCGKEYSFASSLYQHRKTHNIESVYKCSICYKTVANAALLDLHFRSHTELSCGVCGKEFKTKDELKQHMTVHPETASISNPKLHKYVLKKSTKRYYGIRSDEGKLPKAKCLICNKEVNFPEQHARAHENDSNRCKQCGKVFPFQRNLKLHMLSHTGERPHKCEICGKAYVTSTLLKYHFRLHTNELFKCDKCEKTFTLSNLYKRHLKSHQQGMYTCDKCGIRFKRKRPLQKHTIRCPGHQKKPKCNDCGQTFMNFAQLMWHAGKNNMCNINGTPHLDLKTYEQTTASARETIKSAVSDSNSNGSVASEDENRPAVLDYHLVSHTANKCGVCGKDFETPGELTQHMTLHHPNTALINKHCNQCGKVFSRQSYLKIHMLCHTGDRPHKCEVCGQAFVTKTMLKYHFRVHTNEQFKCAKCDKTFILPTVYKRHLKIHDRTPQNNVCYICNKSVKNPQRHARFHANQQRTCAQCGKSFANAQNYRLHCLTHKKERPYKCEICGQSFVTNTLLKDHFRLHTGDLFECGHCDKKYNVARNLRRHLESHEKQTSKLNKKPNPNSTNQQ
ncbi:zinc finger protein 62 homolog [Wyeomyia smithii]|uniref:zinc finger protein 62 homolog n=1 Tax=Wyeomyia smithii TaxID=174621 RepID=UPI002467DC5B|nr:zinc finger protein 62 homolog [Wyeomyia smithii]XP_055541577.1 zinc finger protein 62 homolog [Wyeomyia smithii]XP_055541578.1 zinc finger protein 62 homolog [Wyeomyia smithii]XP_055541579.1 zinc finger protein 62 homolog [Wyeomyia smithii]